MLKIKIYSQAGQSLIETVVAVFILVMGITAALGLASYSLGASTNVSKQIIGTGLAREGLEAVRNMRDTNWLKGTKYTNCYEFVKLDSTGTCFKDWLVPTGIAPNHEGYNISPGGVPASKTYVLDFTASKTGTGIGQNFWDLVEETTNFRLYMDANTYAANPAGLTIGKFYTTNATGTVVSDYSRRIKITTDAAKEPYTTANNPASAPSAIGPRLTITSDVWWKDKKCPEVATWEAAKTSCRVRLEMYLTNWRVY